MRPNSAIRNQIANRRDGMLEQRRKHAWEEQVQSHLSEFHHVLWPMLAQSCDAIQLVLSLIGNLNRLQITMLPQVLHEIGRKLVRKAPNYARCAVEGELASPFSRFPLAPVSRDADALSPCSPVVQARLQPSSTNP
jgi:hypothetical protein